MRQPSSEWRRVMIVRCCRGETGVDGEGDFVFVVELTCSRKSDVWRRGGEGGLI